jgi:hypothetical protein
MMMRNTATYCDGKPREFTALLLGQSAPVYAAVAGTTCTDPLDCVALTAAEAEIAGRDWARRMTIRVATDLTEFFCVIPLPEGWSND